MNSRPSLLQRLESLDIVSMTKYVCIGDGWIDEEEGCRWKNGKSRSLMMRGGAIR